MVTDTRNRIDAIHQRGMFWLVLALLTMIALAYATYASYEFSDEYAAQSDDQAVIMPRPDIRE